MFSRAVQYCSNILLLSLTPQLSLGLGLLHKIRLNFLEASQKFSFSQGRVVSPTPNPHPGGSGLCIYIPQRQGGYPFQSPLTTRMGHGGTILIPLSPHGGTVLTYWCKYLGSYFVYYVFGIHHPAITYVISIFCTLCSDLSSSDSFSQPFGDRCTRDFDTLHLSVCEWNVVTIKTK
jgi:hypothetical protein